VGITTFILISLYIHFHLSFDRFHENQKRIYKIDRIEHLADRIARSNKTWFPISGILKQAFPEINEALVCRYVDGAYFSSTKDRTFYEDDGLYAEKSFFEIFSFKLIEGNPETALNETFSMVITEKTAKKYFPEGSALGKMIQMGDKGEFRITGILQNMPENTEF
jgi:putative ABC transport system permease protein